MNELDRCLDGTSRYAHADKVKRLYEFLDQLGNNPLWQLYVLGIMRDGIRDRRERAEEARAALLNPKKEKRHDRQKRTSH